jgi:lysozyme
MKKTATYSARTMHAAHAARAAHATHATQKRKHPVIFGIIAIVIILILATVLITALNNSNKSVMPYDWSYLSLDDSGRPVYEEEGKYTSVLGVDVSSYDKDFDWEAATNDGISFTFIRIGWRGYTEGGLNTDEYFTQNYTGAKESGLDVGVYFFSSATTEEEAKEEAQFVIDQLDSVDAQLDLPVAFDLENVSDSEGRANNLSSEQASAIANAFCETIESSGYETIIYGNISDLARYDKSVTTEANRNVWLAEYETSAPSADFNFAIWQFSAYGYIEGISRNVDLDIMFVPTS